VSGTSTILKVLSGPHVGAQAAVPSEPLIIGSSDEADVVLSDPHIAPRHCKLHTTAAGVQVEREEGVLYVDGKKADQEDFILAPGQVLTLGSTHLAIGPKGQPWPTMVLPEIREIEEPTETEEEPAEETSDAPAQPTAPVAAEPPRKKRRLPIPAGWIAGTVIVLVAIAAGILSYNAGKQPRAVFSPFEEVAFEENVGRNDQTNERKIADQIEKEFPSIGVQFVEIQGKSHLQLWGRHLDRMAEARAFVNNLETNVPIDFINVNELETSLRELGTLFGYKLDVSVTEPGVARWFGYIPRKEDWDQLAKRVTNDVKLIKANILDLTYGTDLEKELKAQLASAKVGAGLEVKLDPQGITLAGTLPSSAEDAVRKEIQKFEDQHPEIDIQERWATGAANRPTGMLLGSTISGVFVGDSSSWVTLSNGQRLFLGAKLAGDYTLQDIERERLTLTGPGGSIEIPINLEDENPSFEETEEVPTRSPYQSSR